MIAAPEDDCTTFQTITNVSFKKQIKKKQLFGLWLAEPPRFRNPCHLFFPGPWDWQSSGGQTAKVVTWSEADNLLLTLRHFKMEHWNTHDKSAGFVMNYMIYCDFRSIYTLESCRPKFKISGFRSQRTNWPSSREGLYFFSWTSAPWTDDDDVQPQ